MKFRCARDSFISGEKHGAKIRIWHKAGLSKRCLVSFRGNRDLTRKISSVLSTGITQGDARACARPIPRFTRPCLIVPPVSILHTSLSNAERVAHWETTRSSNVHTYIREATVCFPRSRYSMPSCFHEFVKAHRHSVPWNRSTAVERRERTEIAKFRFYYKRQRSTSPNAKANYSCLIFFSAAIFNPLILLYLCIYSGFIKPAILQRQNCSNLLFVMNY